MAHRKAYGISSNAQDAEDIVMACFSIMTDKGEFNDEQIPVPIFAQRPLKDI